MIQTHLASVCCLSVPFLTSPYPLTIDSKMSHGARFSDSRDHCGPDSHKNTHTLDTDSHTHTLDTDRQTDRQTDTHTHRHTQTQTQTLVHSHTLVHSYTARTHATTITLTHTTHTCTHTRARASTLTHLSIRSMFRVMLTLTNSHFSVSAFLHVCANLHTGAHTLTLRTHAHTHTHARSKVG